MACVLILHPTEMATCSEFLHERHGHDIAQVASKLLAQPGPDNFVWHDDDCRAGQCPRTDMVSKGWDDVCEVVGWDDLPGHGMSLRFAL